MASITEAARTTPRAIRLWEREGLLGEVVRDARGERQFTQTQMETAKLIAAAQMAGMSLAEIRDKVGGIGLLEAITEARAFLQQAEASLEMFDL